MVKSIPNFGPCPGAVQGLYPEGKSQQKDILEYSSRSALQSGMHLPTAKCAKESD
jgi:hypothetical protein